MNAAEAALASLRGVELVLTAKCNLRCAYCYQRSRTPASMDWDTLRASIDLLAASSQPVITVNFYGGEPLLERPVLLRAIGYARRVLPSASRRLRLRITTNGTLLDVDLAGFLAAHGVEVQLSFDGVQPAQDQRGPSTFGRLDGLLTSLRRASPVFFDHALTIGVTVTGANVRWLAESIDYFLERRVKRIAIAPRVTPDPDWSRGHELELDRQLERVFSASLDHYRRTGAVPVSIFRRVARAPSEGAALHCGAAAAEVLTVDVDGRITACVMFATSYGAVPPGPQAARVAGLQIGFVRDSALGRKIAAYPVAARATTLFDRPAAWDAQCRRCSCQDDCIICAASIAQSSADGRPTVISPLPCAFTRTVAKYQAWFPVQPSIADIVRGRASPLPVLTQT